MELPSSITDMLRPATPTPTVAPRPNRHQRRALAARGDNVPALRDLAVTSDARDRLERMMKHYGNEISQQHREALFAILHALTLMANGTRPGRRVFDLDCGCGKTQSVIAWCAAMIHSKKPWSVAVCSTRVEDLCDVKQQLVEHHGIDEDLIGLKHSYRHDPEKAREGVSGYATLPATEENQKRPILLVTHNRVRGAKGNVAIDPFNGTRRNLVIWDESLLVSSHRAVDCVTIEASIGWLKPYVRPCGTDSDLRRVHRYLTDVWTLLERDIARQQYGGIPSRIKAKPLDPDTMDRYIAALPSKTPSRKALIAFLQMAQEPLRVVAETGQGDGGFVQYQIVVPSELDNVAVLDASWAIRDLEKMDTGLKRDPVFEGVRTFKTYSDVTVNWMTAKSGRQSVTKDFMGRRETRKIAKEIIDVINGIPAEEGIILNTFLVRQQMDAMGKRSINGVDIAAVLRGDLEDTGIDTTATVRDQHGTERPRFVWLTHGNGTAVSEHSYCSNIIFVGVLHRRNEDLAGAIVGQRDNLLTPVNAKDVAAVQRSEIAYTLHQAMMRGSARITRRDRALPMKVWIAHHDEAVKPLIEKVMPGIKWAAWEPQHVVAVKRTVSQAAAKVAASIKGLDPSVERIATTKIRGLARLEDLQRDSFRRAVKEALEKLPDWCHEGRSLVRKR